MDEYEQIDQILKKYGLTQEVELNRKKVKVFFNGKSAVMEYWKACKLEAELTAINPYLRLLVQDVEDK
jgi:hypothetical protein